MRQFLGVFFTLCEVEKVDLEIVGVENDLEEGLTELAERHQERKALLKQCDELEMLNNGTKRELMMMSVKAEMKKLGESLNHGSKSRKNKITRNENSSKSGNSSKSETIENSDRNSEQSDVISENRDKISESSTSIKSTSIKSLILHPGLNSKSSKESIINQVETTEIPESTHSVCSESQNNVIFAMESSTSINSKRSIEKRSTEDQLEHQPEHPAVKKLKVSFSLENVPSDSDISEPTEIFRFSNPERKHSFEDCETSAVSDTELGMLTDF